jgi:hypothetical protein
MVMMMMTNVKYNSFGRNYAYTESAYNTTQTADIKEAPAEFKPEISEFE